MITHLKKLIPAKTKRYLLSKLSNETIALAEGRRAFLFLAADYGNIGDLAITAAQQNFLERHAGVTQVIQVPISRTAHLMHFICKYATSEDLISIVGGGNMGVLYPDIENLRQWVIKSFPNNRIVCFPQTLDWTDDAVSEKALGRIRKVYASHPDLHVFARESVSFEKLKQLFFGCPSVRVGYAPDIVMSATSGSFGPLPDTTSKGILLALRNDRERVLSSEQQNWVLDTLTQTGQDVTITDTHGGGWGLSPEAQNKMLTEKIAEFSAGKLVITDRLHGMILAALSGVPCLVLPSASHKLYHTWNEWLADIPQIRHLTVDDMISLPTVVAELLKVGPRDTQKPLVDIQVYRALAETLVAP